MRLLLVGAFPYPHFQGSQVYFQEQAIALRAAGAEVSLLTYGRESHGGEARSKNQSSENQTGRDIRPVPTEGSRAKGAAFDPARVGRGSVEHWRGLDGFEHFRAAPEAAAPSLRSGLNWGKPRADLGLAMTLRDAVASSSDRNDAYDAILTHNAEAAFVALSSLPKRRPPLVYCVHTLLGQELSAYLKGPKNNRFLHSLSAGIESSAVLRAGTEFLTRAIDAAGDTGDRWLSRHVDAWIALTQSCARVMRTGGNRPGAIVPPPLPDPECAHEALRPEEAARRQGLESGRFFLYTGNLDAYQELDLLAGAADELARRSPAPPVLVIATHRREGPRPSVAEWASSIPGVEYREVSSSQEMLELLAAARASLVMRRATGGFPIKLVNSLAVSTPPIAFHADEWGLTHETNSLIASPDRPVQSLADAIERVARDDGLAKRLAAGARALYLDRHLPEQAAEKTLALIESLRPVDGG